MSGLEVSTVRLLVILIGVVLVVIYKMTNGGRTVRTKTLKLPVRSEKSSAAQDYADTLYVSGKHFRMSSFAVAGTSFRQVTACLCKAGDPVMLLPEPANKKDPDAVKVCRMNGDKIGYVPTDESGGGAPEEPEEWQQVKAFITGIGQPHGDAKLPIGITVGWVWECASGDPYESKAMAQYQAETLESRQRRRRERQETKARAASNAS